MSPAELVNLSLQQEVEIEPKIKLPEIALITDKLPSSTPPIPVRVPLYIALHLQRSNSATIRPPPYLSPEFLSRAVERESEMTGFLEVPEFLFEHAHLLPSEATDTLVTELKRVRLNKVLRGMGSMDGKAMYVNGLTRWEFNEVKPMILGGMRIGGNFKAAE